MRSSRPKVLHPLCGRPMLLHVLDALVELPLERVVVVVGHGAEDVTKTLHEQLTGCDVPIEFVEQRRQRGTGDAASVALTAFADDLDVEDDLFVVMGDVPLLRAETLAALATEHRITDAAASLLTARVTDPTGYGRIVRDAQGRVERIVEHADASDVERALDEINPSIYCFRRGLLAPALRRLSPENARGEYYLTDVVSVLRETGHAIVAVEADDPMEALGVNDRAQLADAERELRARINLRWMREGVTMTDPERTYLDTTVELAADVTLLPGTILQGHTAVGRGAVIGPDCQLIDTAVGERAVVRQTVAHDSVIGDDAMIGPYASLRAGTRLAAGVHVGTFVEVKNSELGEGAKAAHQAYIGDATIGAGANIGAGTITANYDGRHKHHTTVGKDARIGSNTVLVAPVTVGDGAYTGAGAVVTSDVPPGALAKGVPAKVTEGWAAGRDDGGDAAATEESV
jgi:bifunctional UDP-N-acetylglucosamine pyrophosphorylase/glucosamine-1-phosphate N-acetyltransferase